MVDFGSPFVGLSLEAQQGFDPRETPLSDLRRLPSGIHERLGVQ